jgi:hypothetical protein
MIYGFIPPDAPYPTDRQKEPPCEAIERAVAMLVEAIIDHYPEQEASIRAGVNVRILTVDGVDHLFRLVDRR